MHHPYLIRPLDLRCLKVNKLFSQIPLTTQGGLPAPSSVLCVAQKLFLKLSKCYLSPRHWISVRQHSWLKHLAREAGCSEGNVSNHQQVVFILGIMRSDFFLERSPKQGQLHTQNVALLTPPLTGNIALHLRRCRSAEITFLA